jgi:hypothetical protein
MSTDPINQTTAEAYGWAAFWLGLVLICWITWIFVTGDLKSSDAMLRSWRVPMFVPMGLLWAYLVGKSPI